MSNNPVTLPVMHFLSGGFGGVCNTVIGHPFDTIKVRLQTMQKTGNTPIYKGTWDCANKIMKNEGVRALYKGMGATIVSVSPIFALSFFGFGLAKSFQHTSPDTILSIPQLFASGSFSGILTTPLTTPVERVKCLLQVQEGSKKPDQYQGPIDVVRQLYKQGGLKSIYKGTVLTVLRDMPGNGMYFMTYEYVMRVLTPIGSSDNCLFRTAFAGGMSGVVYWIVAMPADILKTRFQSAREGKYPNGHRDVYKSLIQEHGFIALYRGSTPVILRSLLGSSACFIGFELAMEFLS